MAPEPVYGIRYQSVWGWMDPQDNRLYAIIGSTDGTYIIEVTNPANPVKRAFIPGIRDSCIWHEYKTYQNFLYIISDDPVNAYNQNGLQIVDLSPLPDSVKIVHNGNTIIERAHTLTRDGDLMYFNIPKGPSVGGSSKMAVFSLANPALPQLLRRLEDDYPTLHGDVHDAFVRNDTIYASAGWDGLFVYRYDRNLNKFFLLGSLTSYPEQGYNHSSALSEDGSILVMCDEVPDGLAIKILDVSDLSNIQVLTTFRSHQGATPHNPYMIGNRWAIIAYYQDGVYIYDISNPLNPVVAGYFDTHPQNGDNNGYPQPAYMGCWAVYHEFGPGLLLASDMQNGLFILDASQIIPTTSVPTYPRISAIHPQHNNFLFLDLTGRFLNPIPDNPFCSPIKNGNIPVYLYYRF